MPISFYPCFPYIATHAIKLFRFPATISILNNQTFHQILQSLIFTWKCSQTGSFVQLSSMKILLRKNDRWMVRESWAKIQIEILIGLRSWILRGRVQSPRIYVCIYICSHPLTCVCIYVCSYVSTVQGVPLILTAALQITLPVVCISKLFPRRNCSLRENSGWLVGPAHAHVSESRVQTWQRSGGQTERKGHFDTRSPSSSWYF